VKVGSLADLEVVPKLRRRVEDNMFVARIGKQDVELLFPAFCLSNPAGGAKPGFTRMEDLFLKLTLRAFPLMKAHCLSTTGEHFRNVFGDRGTAEQVFVLPGEIRPMVGEDLLELFPSDDLHTGLRQGRVLSKFSKENARRKKLINYHMNLVTSFPSPQRLS